MALQVSPPPTPAATQTQHGTEEPRSFRTGVHQDVYPERKRDIVSGRPEYSPEFKEEAAKMVVESDRPIAQVAREIKVNETTLGYWVKRYRGKARG